MKKRTIIAIIITVFILFLSNKQWLIFKPMSVDFDISGKGNYNIEVQLNKKDNDNFNEKKSFIKIFTIDKPSHEQYIIPRAKSPKRIRFLFENLNNPVEIKNITLKNGKYKIDDLSKFTLNEGELVVKNDTLVITPPHNKLENLLILTYNKPLKLHTSTKFDIKVFLIIIILTFFLAYKLTDYAANFNTVKNKSRIEIIFLAIFFIFLFIPMSHINQDKVSVKENRMLAKWKPFINSNGEINHTFGKNYDKWFNDRFNLRQFLTDVHTRIAVKLTGKAEKGIVDKSGQVYVDFELNLNNYSLNKINDYDYNALIMFDKFLKEHNIELYVLFVPNKKYVYPLEKKLIINDDSPQHIDNEIKKLNKNYNMHIINPLKEMQKASKDNYMYFKTEHHWTDDGAFIGYQTLMKEINKKHPDIKVLQEQDFDIKDSILVRGTWGRKFDWGQAPERLNLPLAYTKKLHDTKYRYFTEKNSQLLEKNISEVPFKYTINYSYPKGADYRVIVLGTSMSENLCEFIPYTFKNVFRLRNNNLFARRGNLIKGMYYKEEFKIMKHYKDTILDYHPDIVIFCIAYWEITRLSDLFNME